MTGPERRDDGQSWMACMRRGAFEEAWTISDRVLAARAGQSCVHLPRHQQWIWNGTPLAGRRVLVRCYHGLGDTLQFIRFVPRVVALASEVTVWVQPALIPVLERTPGFGRLLALHEGDPGVPYDVDVELQELPHLFRIAVTDLPGPVPYLHVAPAALPRRGRLRAGLVWRAGEWAPHRSIRLDRLKPLTELPVDWYVLQGEPGLAECPSEFGTIVGTHSILDAAEAIAGLDLVISVDTMAAHLAGALGVPVWTLLQADPDWRWMDGRPDSPWYPTMRLFRQERAGEWGPVIERVAHELREACGRQP